MKLIFEGVYAGTRQTAKGFVYTWATQVGILNVYSERLFEIAPMTAARWELDCRPGRYGLVVDMIRGSNLNGKE